MSFRTTGKGFEQITRRHMVIHQRSEMPSTKTGQIGPSLPGGPARSASFVVLCFCDPKKGPLLPDAGMAELRDRWAEEG